MDVVREIQHNGETLTIVHDEQGLFMLPVQSMKRIAKSLSYACKKLTDDEITNINKRNLLERYTSMFPQVYGEDDPLWIQYRNEGRKQEKVQVIQERRKIEGHIYIVKCMETGLYKIGRSADVKTRIKNIHWASPTRIVLIALGKSTDCITHEECLHELFADKKVKGEWFALDADDLLKVKVKENDAYKI